MRAFISTLGSIARQNDRKYSESYSASLQHLYSPNDQLGKEERFVAPPISVFPWS